MRQARNIFEDREGATALEFALLIVPFIVIAMAIVDIGLMNLINGSLDNALHMTVRKVRVGTSKTANWNLPTFKSNVCANMALSFNCSANLLIRSTVITNMNSVTRLSGITDGVLDVTENYDTGNAGDFVLVQAYLPWTPMMDIYPYNANRLTQGGYVLQASDLFKNEPY